MPRLVRVVLACLAVVGGSAQVALADGGTIQLAERVAGPYSLTAYTSPSPIRVGTVDVSVMVSQKATSNLVQDAHVTVTAEPVGHPGDSQTFQATHDQATNKLFYAANVDLPTAGLWKLTVQVVGRDGDGSADFTVDASAAVLGFTPLEFVFLAVPVAGLIALILVSRFKRRGRKAASDG